MPFHIGEARFSAEAESLAKVAGQAARTAVERQLEDVCVAGSLPPALGSYRPDLFDYQRSIAIHRKLIAGLEPYVDVWLAETQSSIAEARAVHEALVGNSKPLWLSFTLLDDVLKGARLRSGETVYDAVTVGLALGAEAVLFNCSQPEVMGLAIDEASRAVDASLSPPKLGVYANAFPVVDETAEANAILLDIRPDLGPAAYVSWARQWIGQGASIIGGCCGIGPEHIAQLRNQLQSSQPSFD